MERISREKFCLMVGSVITFMLLIRAAHAFFIPDPTTNIVFLRTGCGIFGASLVLQLFMICRKGLTEGSALGIGMALGLFTSSAIDFIQPRLSWEYFLIYAGFCLVSILVVIIDRKDKSSWYAFMGILGTLFVASLATIKTALDFFQSFLFLFVLLTMLWVSSESKQTTP